jgi:hypothetical protein
VHKALPNRTRSIRMSFDARYQKLSEPMADVNLVPYAGCGSWDLFERAGSIATTIGLIFASERYI